MMPDSRPPLRQTWQKGVGWVVWRSLHGSFRAAQASPNSLSSAMSTRPAPAPLWRRRRGRASLEALRPFLVDVHSKGQMLDETARSRDQVTRAIRALSVVHATHFTIEQTTSDRRICIETASLARRATRALCSRPNDRRGSKLRRPSLLIPSAPRSSISGG